MNISALFIKRPVMTTLVMLAILLFGITGYRLLPVNDLPNVDFPTIQVNALLPGATPETMASAVALPLEKQFSTIAGIDSMTSVSYQGSTTITLQFSLDRSLDAAALDVQSAISVAQGQLPTGMPTPPSYQKVNPADQPILYLALTSPTLPMSQVDEYGETLMAQRISMVSGVAQVQVYGSQKYAVRVQMDPNKLAAKGIGLDQVAAAVASGNVNLPTGTLYGPHVAYTVQASGQLLNAAAYRPLVVMYANGEPVRLGALGHVIDSVENDKTAAWYIDHDHDQRSVILAIRRQPGTNTVAVAQAVKDLIPTFQSQLPASVTLHTLYDRSTSIRQSVSDVKFTLLLTLILVVLVIFLFLRNVSATVIPSMALPMSIVGTFAVMYLLNYSLDNLSLMALTLAVGFVVDDAIVMLENIVRHMEMGEGIVEAALAGSKEIGFTILTMTFSLVAVFIPVLFMGGIVGRLFHEFAVTIGAAILISGFVSLTLTPMLASRFLKHQSEVHHGRIYNASEAAFNRLLGGYERGLKWSIAHRRLVMIFSGVVLVLTGWLFTIIPKGFLPSEDASRAMVFTQAKEGISYDAMVRHQQVINHIIQGNPDVEAFFSTAGGRGFLASNQGICFIRFKPRNQRALSVDQEIAKLRPQLMAVPGIVAFIQNPPPIQIGGQLTKSLYQYTLQGADTQQLYAVATTLENRMKGLPGLIDVTSDLQIKNPQVEVEIERDKASSYGVTAEAIESALYDAYGTRQISYIYAPNNTYQVILEVENQYQEDPAALSMLYVHSNTGQLVPLNAVAKLTRDLGPLSISHTGQLPSVTVSFNLAPGTPLGNAIAGVQKLAREVVPATITTSLQGTAQAFQASTKGLGWLLVLAILVIYTVLGILYESFIHPFTILSALPFAGFGALVTLLIFRVDLSIYAFVGIIMLVGLVKKNGIMMIDFALEAQRKEGKAPADAIYEACVIRFRPIMMTTMAALMGTLPIALGMGAGAESRRPLGLAVVGGLVFSQFLTLFVTPVFYLYMERAQAFISRKMARSANGSAIPETE
ncbi:MAG: acriflavine resistance protein B [Acidobacteria bacterium 21-70-11]|nr:MAG: acriflavine resistance protein B [Acidobacteria bacterium 21-70-11]OYW06199.1 MAG: acriflavine resistance protein B [Acidobacteria bacterium 37-71-11]HQU33226.1 efflux RND transporter permease subunit [Thermoanaerobaculaceae bacterium]